MISIAIYIIVSECTNREETLYKAYATLYYITVTIIDNYITMDSATILTDVIVTVYAFIFLCAYKSLLLNPGFTPITRSLVSSHGILRGILDVHIKS